MSNIRAWIQNIHNGLIYASWLNYYNPFILSTKYPLHQSLFGGVQVDRKISKSVWQNKQTSSLYYNINNPLKKKKTTPIKFWYFNKGIFNIFVNESVYCHLYSIKPKVSQYVREIFYFLLIHTDLPSLKLEPMMRECDNDSFRFRSEKPGITWTPESNTEHKFCLILHSISCQF